MYSLTADDVVTEYASDRRVTWRGFDVSSVVTIEFKIKDAAVSSFEIIISSIL